MPDLDQIVRTHDPHEPRVREAAAERPQRVGGIARSQLRLDGRGAQPGMAARAFGAGQPLGQTRHAGDRLERVLRRDQPPHLVEVEQPEGELGEMAMARMGGIERAAEQTHAPWRLAAEGTRRQRPAHGRVWPVPRTMYL